MPHHELHFVVLKADDTCNMPMSLLYDVGVGRDLIWYYKIQVVFDSSTDDGSGTTVIDRLYIDFDRVVPPRFERDLDWSNEPAPPTVC